MKTSSKARARLKRASTLRTGGDLKDAKVSLCVYSPSIDLTKLESRPLRGKPWEYLFYVDVAAGRDDLKCGRALVHLAEFARSLRTLGSYPSWKQLDPGPEATEPSSAAAAAAGRPDWEPR